MSTPLIPLAPDPIDALLSAHGLRRTAASRRVLGWLLAHPDTSYTHAQLQSALQADSGEPVANLAGANPQWVSDSAGAGPVALDRVTLYRLIDRLTQVGLLLCRVDANRVRRYQAMPASVHALPHFECQSCHRDQPLQGTLQGSALDLEVAAQSALQALKALGYQGLSLDLAVRGVCVDCATATTAPAGQRTAPLTEAKPAKKTAPVDRSTQGAGQ
ncbi:MAG: Fur family transcriptional regulator [Rhodoferax sp.]|uniref:Fur family transcriptional regulator n=1 Tax=Rhodoferax sp. TaxID=50421 RepID=UPI0026142FB9|nr:Fur family transcriptional regulator [Rhodoferax sp.]MDD2882060.1 Fur family transcriptional regulator [Rhodoferax sp.]